MQHIPYSLDDRRILRPPQTIAFAASLLCACGGTANKHKPPPEFDDVDANGDAPQQVDTERATALLAELPFRERMRGLVRGSIQVTATFEMRATAAGEPGDIAEVLSLSGNRPHRVRIKWLSYYSAKPPYRLEAGTEIFEIDGQLEHRFDFRNHPKALWIRVNRGGVAQPPVRRSPSRDTLFKYLPVTGPEVAVGTSVTISTFDAEAQGDHLERVTVRAKGEALVGGRRLPTVVLDHHVAGITSMSVIAGGLYIMRLRLPDMELWYVPGT